MNPAWIKEPIEIFGLGMDIWTERKRLRDLGIRAAKTLVGGRKHVGIFGIAGTGKSTLGELLTGSLDPWSTAPLNYEESPKKETQDKKEGTIPTRVWVAPGQARTAADEGMAKTRGGIDLSAMLDRVGGGEFDIIINVVSWGYAAFHPASLVEVSGHNPSAPAPIQEHLQHYLKKCREAELSALHRLVGRLHSTSPEVLLFLTVVTKADLWWNQREAVQAHYTSICEDAFRSVKATRGDRFQSGVTLILSIRRRSGTGPVHRSSGPGAHRGS